MINKSNKVIIFFVLVTMLLGFVGCKDNEAVQQDNSSIQSEGSKVPIVIVDDDASSTTQSDVDQVIDDWENTTPSIEVEIDTPSGGGSSSSSNSSNTTTSSNPSTSDNSFETPSQNDNSGEQTSGDTESGGQESTKPDRPDDGYFDVAV